MATLTAPPVVAAADWRRLRWREIPTFALPAARWWVHHGASGDSTLRTLLGYERYHVQELGWRAPGYSFAICYENGQATIYVLRDWGGIGAHTLGDNDESHGVVLVGDWTSTRVPDPVVHALAWLILRGDERERGPREITGGHRDAPGAETACPGDAGMRAITRAKRLIEQSAAGPVEPDPDEEEEDEMAIDVVEVGDEVWLIVHPWRVGPYEGDGAEYWLNLARSPDNRQYRGPWKWTRGRLDLHPDAPAAV